MCCPDCGDKMRVRDSKQRIVQDESGEKYIFKLRRFRCDNCQKLHTEIPDCIAPYKQYGKNVIDDILNGECDYFIADASTIWRWKKRNTHPLCNDISDLKE